MIGDLLQTVAFTPTIIFERQPKLIRNGYFNMFFQSLKIDIFAISHL